MTRLAILLSLAVSVLPAQLFAQNTRWGSLAIRFVYDGEPPKAKTIRITKDHDALGDTIGDESLLVNARNRGIANVVLYLLPAKNKKLRVHAAYDATAKARKMLGMRRGRFEPHMLLARTSQTIVLKNTDTLGHHARILFSHSGAM